MQRAGLPLLVHGEVTDPGDRPLRPRAGLHRHEADPAAARLPGAEDRLRAHHDARGGAVRARGRPIASRRRSPRTTCSTTATRSSIGGIRPHYYCLPVLKREVHRQALVAAATSGSAKFFLGTDSAPHAGAPEGARRRLRRLLHGAVARSSCMPRPSTRRARSTASRPSRASTARTSTACRATRGTRHAAARTLDAARGAALRRRPNSSRCAAAKP